jgi:hypothetical protein
LELAGKPSAVKACTLGLIAEGAMGAAPPGWKEGWEMRPTCQSWSTIGAPLMCTAFVTHFQPSICSLL